MATAKIVWNRGLQFVGTSGSNHAIVVDTSPDVGGFNAGPTPVELVLIAAASCTGMDVASILKKKRIDFNVFEIEVNEERATELPKYVKKIRLIYKIWGQNITEEAFKQAIELSLEKYCTVSNTLKGRAEISYEYRINPAA